MSMPPLQYLVERRSEKLTQHHLWDGENKGLRSFDLWAVANLHSFGKDGIGVPGIDLHDVLWI